ncbi:protein MICRORCHIDIA 1 [Selaginella moellendorffii]|nr:protein MICRORCHIDIA 1 [Selaginella moellendorffii]|eukprot:XP_002968723.2 protein MICRORCHIDIA 1 [Selaginella moellendorffii]
MGGEDNMIDLTSDDDDDEVEIIGSISSFVKMEPVDKNTHVKVEPAPVQCSVGETSDSSFRHFWRAGDYETSSFSMSVQGGMDHVRVHPKFLHSNATSHKWALGAIAELLDNAIDEANNGATFIKIDKVTNFRDGSPGLLFLDNGGGMSPEKIRQCMSFGYSQKCANAIGQYGNGFKTSTMRLGADVIVLTRCVRDSVTTQSVGLLSYTFLRKTGRGDILVPMVDYERVSGSPGHVSRVIRSTTEDFEMNLNTILQWSPFSTEAQVLAQFEHMESPHGTKVIIYNLWLNDDGVLELDFDTDPHDIKLRENGAKSDARAKELHKKHLSYQLRYSLRAYASILYLRLPSGFRITLRGKLVVHHKIDDDLKFPEYIMYKPQVDGITSGEVVTCIGFTKEAPLLNVHGFCVYHKNRLIMPFWNVFHDNSSRGRGVIGILEANFIEPAHDKQDFEKTCLLLRLENRLKQMTLEYWNTNASRIGYQTKPKQKRITYPAPPRLLRRPEPVPEEPDNVSDERPSEQPYPDEERPTISNANEETPGRSLRKRTRTVDYTECSTEVPEKRECEGAERAERVAGKRCPRCTELESKNKEYERELAAKSSETKESPDYAKQLEELELKSSSLEKKCQALEREKTEAESRCMELQVQNFAHLEKVSALENELLRTKNKYIMLLMTSGERRGVAAVKQEA